MCFRVHVHLPGRLARVVAYARCRVALRVKLRVTLPWECGVWSRPTSPARCRVCSVPCVVEADGVLWARAKVSCVVGVV